jgi:hypothetical protein
MFDGKFLLKTRWQRAHVDQAVAALADETLNFKIVKVKLYLYRIRYDLTWCNHLTRYRHVIGCVGVFDGQIVLYRFGLHSSSKVNENDGKHTSQNEKKCQRD